MTTRIVSVSKACASALALAIAMAGCAGGAMRGLPPANPAAAPGMVPQSSLAANRGTNAAGPIVLSPSKLTLYGTGKSGASPVLVSENRYRGKFTVGGSCAKIASVTPAAGKGPLFNTVVTPLAKGKCTLVFADAKGHKAPLSVVDRPGGRLATSLIIPIRGPRSKPHGKGQKYISPSTQAMTVSISGPTTLSTVSGLTTLSPGCSLTLAGLACTFNASLASCPSTTPNCYTATITTYDSYDPATNTIPSNAAPLSISISSFGIADNQTNTVTFNFSGIPAQIVAVPASALSTQSGNVIDLVGPGAHPMYAEAIDADNNVIAGIGGPSYAISAQGNLQVTVTQPPPGSPRFTVSPPATLAIPAYNATLTITASYGAGQTNACTFTGAVCQGAVTVDMQSLLAVASGYSVSLFAAEKGLGPISTITSGVGNTATDLQFDSQGNLFAAEALRSVSEYALGATIAFRTITTGVSNPVKLAVDPEGNLFVLNSGNNTVTEYTPGATSPAQTISSVIPNADMMVVDANDDVWVGAGPLPGMNPGPGEGVTYYAHGSSAGVALSGLVGPVGIALDQNDTLYVSDETYTVPNQSSECGEGDAHFCTIYAYAYGTTSSPVTYASQSYGGHLAYVPGKGLFADDSTGYKLAFYREGLAPPVGPAAFTAGLNAGSGAQLAVDELGNIFMSEPFNNTVYGYLFNQFAPGGIGENVPPFVTMTNGLSFPGPLAISP